MSSKFRSWRLINVLCNGGREIALNQKLSFKLQSLNTTTVMFSLKHWVTIALAAIALLLIFSINKAHAEVDCSKPPPTYTDADLNSPMRFFSSDNGCWGNAVNFPYMAVGRITEDTPAAFTTFAAMHPPVAPIELVSRGGSLLAGVKFGEMIRSRGYDTSLGKICASACAYAIIGGNRRYILQETEFDSFQDNDNRNIGADGTQLGIHQFYQREALTEPLKKAFTAADRSSDQMLLGMLLEYTLRMGVDTHFVSAASGVEPHQVRWVTPDEMLTWNVDNVRRRYTSLVLRSFGKTGSYAEVGNIRGADAPSSLRLFCQMGVEEPMFTFVMDFPDASSTGQPENHPNTVRDHVRSLLGKMNIVLDAGEAKPLVVPFVVQDLQAVAQENGAVRVFSVVRAAGFARQNAERLVRVALQDNGNLPRSEWTFQDVLKFKIEGDHKLVRLAMRNCVGE